MFNDPRYPQSTGGNPQTNYNYYNPYDQHFQNFRRAKLRQAEEDIYKEYEALTRQPQIPAQPSIPTTVKLAKPEGTYFLALVDNYEDALKYPVDPNGDGDDMYFIRKDNAAVYRKALNLGKGVWEVETLIGDVKSEDISTNTETTPSVPQFDIATAFGILTDSKNEIIAEIRKLKVPNGEAKLPKNRTPTKQEDIPKEGEP